MKMGHFAIMEFKSFILWMVQVLHVQAIQMEPSSRDYLKCLTCNDVDTVDACIEERACATGQYCYLEKYPVFVRDARGNEKTFWKYNAGCRNSSICHDLQCLGMDIGVRNHTVGKRTIYSPITCSECCMTDRCNMDLCDFVKTGSDSRRCYSCNDIRDPTECNYVTYCQPNEKCFIAEEIRINPDGSLSKVFQQRCVRKQLCKAIHEHNLLRLTTTTTKEHSIFTTQPRPSSTKEIIELTPPPVLRSLLPHVRSHNLIQIWEDCCDGDYCNSDRNPETTSAPGKFLCPTTKMTTTTLVSTHTSSTDEPNPVAIIG